MVVGRRAAVSYCLSARSLSQLLQVLKVLACVVSMPDF